MKKASCLTLLLLGVGCSDADPVDPVDAGEIPDTGGPQSDAGPTPCIHWDVTYDLDGSQFEIANTPFEAGDGVLDIGPGTVQLRFSGDDDGPQFGPVRMLEYVMAMEFTVSNVETDLDVTSGPDACGVAEGTWTSSVVTWSTPLRNYESSGTVTCRSTEALCAFAGLPFEEPVDRSSTTDQPLMPFVFSSSVTPSSFTMAPVEVPNDDPGDTFLILVGRESERQCVTEAPSCP